MGYLKTLLGTASIIFVIVIFVAIFSEDENKCLRSGCNRTARAGHCYCYVHDSSKFSSSYRFNSSTRRSSYSSSRSSANSSTGSSSRTSSSSRNTSSSRQSMPDCDDYDGYDDFMDDWDGNMPDGSDAEDYWENW